MPKCHLLTTYISNFLFKNLFKIYPNKLFQYKTNQICFNSSQVFDN